VRPTWLRSGPIADARRLICGSGAPAPRMMVMGSVLAAGYAGGAGRGCRKVVFFLEVVEDGLSARSTSTVRSRLEKTTSPRAARRHGCAHLGQDRFVPATT